MSALTEFLHKLVDRAGLSELHSEVDAIEDPSKAPATVNPDGTIEEAKPADEVPETGEEEAPNAAE